MTNIAIVERETSKNTTATPKARMHCRKRRMIMIGDDDDDDDNDEVDAVPSLSIFVRLLLQFPLPIPSIKEMTTVMSSFSLPLLACDSFSRILTASASSSVSEAVVANEEIVSAEDERNI